MSERNNVVIHHLTGPRSWKRRLIQSNVLHGIFAVIIWLMAIAAVIQGGFRGDWIEISLGILFIFGVASIE